MSETVSPAELKSFKKGQIIQRQGEISSNLFFVKKGLLRSYIIDSKGKEHIFMFAPEDWTITDNVSFNTKAEMFIDALEDSEVEIYRKENVLANIGYHQDNRKQILSLIKRISVLQKRIILLMSASAIERYDHFIETYPQITQRVPQKMIASFLGITPEALSKIKSLKIRKN